MDRNRDSRARASGGFDDDETFIDPEFRELDPIRDLQPQIDLGYTDDWMEISRRTRESVDWVCEQCGKSFVDNKTKLHVHHRDNDKQNNLPDNLEVLCVRCHEEAHGFRID